VRILIHGINFSPELTGIGKYTGEMADWLEAQGHEVRVVTAPPYYPQWYVSEGFENWWSKEQAPELKNQTLNIHSELKVSNGSLVVYRCPIWVPINPTGLKRLLHLASFALSSFPIMLRQVFWRPDVVWVVQPPLFCAPQAWLVAKLSGAKSWIHIQDYEVDAAFQLGLLNGAFLHWIVANGERWLMRHFDRVSTISHRMLEMAVAKGVTSDRVVLFPNWVDFNVIIPSPLCIENTEVQTHIRDYRSELDIPKNTIVALYSGNMGNKQGLEILSQVATLLREDPNIVFVYCGLGAGRDELVMQCVNFPNVKFLDLQPLAHLSDLLCMADIHLLPQRADAADLVMPSKLTGMLASGRPVVTTAHKGTELANLVKDCGLVVPPEQSQAFAEAIMKLASDADLRETLGSAGRAYAESYLDKNTILRRFEAELNQLTQR
jgi:colanic acid biosynthesis glycosyl transferase WcaI